MNKDFLQTRRDFLRQGIGLAAAAGTIPNFLAQSAMAATKNGPAKDAPILLVVQLSGGNDGLNTVVPYANDNYYRARPRIAIKAKELLKLNDELGLHPAMSGFKSLYDDGLLNIIQGVGYPNPSRSHFQSMDYWHAGNLDEHAQTGWIGRLFDHNCGNGHLNGKSKSPSLGISVGNTLNPALHNNSSVGIAMKNPQQLYRMTQFSKSDNDTGKEQKSGNAELDFLQRTAVNARLSAEDIFKKSSSVKNQVEYPRNEFANGLSIISRMIAGGMDTRVYYISLGGFDTHANQQGNHQRLLETLSSGIQAFQNDLKKLGLDQQVLGLTFSEFGRRVNENGSGGTDHGKAAPLFLFGSPVKAGITGQHPSLSELAKGDLKYHTDFRQIYSTVINKWMGCDAEKILSNKFADLPVLKG